MPSISGFFLLLNLILLGISYLLLRLLAQKEAARQLAAWGASFWARHILSLARVRVEVEGLEYLPCEDKLCFISNHQSYVDIAVLRGRDFHGYLSRGEPQ